MSDNSSDLNLLTNVVDHWISVSLKDPFTKQLAVNLNTHHCFKKSCLKRSEFCKYNFPRFPSLRSLIAIPARIKYPENTEKMEKSIKKATEIKTKVKKILENNEQMDRLINVDQPEVDVYIEWKRLSQLVDYIKSCLQNKIKNEPKLVDETFLKEFNQFDEVTDYLDIAQIPLSGVLKF